MKLEYLLGGLVFILGLLYSPTVFAVEANSVIINEIMWMGSSRSSSDEWIELKNNTNEKIIVSGWTIENAGKSGKNITIPADKDYIIEPESYYLISHYSPQINQEKTILTVNPNLIISSISLANSNNGNLVLKDQTGKIIDQVKGDIWPAGDNSKKYSMERVENADGTKNESWQNALESKGFIDEINDKGTPSYENSKFIPPPVKEFPESVTKYLDMPKTLQLEGKVTKVIDGDTIEVLIDGKVTRVRLIGVDTPESEFSSQFGINEPYYQKAKDLTSQLLDKNIDLLVSQNLQDQYDNYNRLLAMVVFDDQLFNIKLLAEGLAKSYYLDNELVIADEWLIAENLAKNQQLNLWQPVDSQDIIINEVLPSPVGSDSENEWIELFNAGDEDINLENWILDYAEQGSDPYCFPKQTIKAKEYLIVPITQSGIALNNNGDSVRLFTPGLGLVEEILYPKAKEGYSWCRIIDQWDWCSNPTKRYSNIDNQLDSSVTEDNKIILIKNISSLSNGTQVTTIGVMTVTPGILSNQYFYIQDNQAGIQIYSYYKNFPNLSIGDKIKVKGVLSGSNIRRIKISASEDITIIEKNINIEPKSLSLSQINHDIEAQLVRITGKIIKLSGINIYLEMDGSQVIVQIRQTAGFGRPSIKKGDQLEIIGIVYRSNDKFYILPRFPDDIKIVESLPIIERIKNSTSNKLVKTAYAADNSQGKVIVLGMQDSSLNDILYNDQNYLSKIEKTKLWIIISQYAIISTIVLLILWIVEWLWPKKLFQKI